MSTDSQAQQAFSLVELMVATAITVVLASMVVFLTTFTSRSFVAMADYTDMDLKSQLAVDQISRLIRSARQVTSISANSLALLDSNGNSLNLSYDSSGKTFSVAAAGHTNVYLTTCDSFQFWIYQHTPISNTFDCYAPAYVTNARLVQFTWTCSRPLTGANKNTESVQSAEVALRNK